MNDFNRWNLTLPRSFENSTTDTMTKTISNSCSFISKHFIEAYIENNNIALLSTPISIEMPVMYIPLDELTVTTSIIDDSFEKKIIKNITHSCRYFKNGTWVDDSTTSLVVDVNLGKVTCLSSHLTLFSVTRNIIETTIISKVEIENPTTPNKNGSELYWLFWLMIILVFCCCCCCIGFIVFCCWRRRRRQNEEKKEKVIDVELENQMGKGTV